MARSLPVFFPLIEGHIFRDFSLIIVFNERRGCLAAVNALAAVNDRAEEIKVKMPISQGPRVWIPDVCYIEAFLPCN